MRAERVSRYDAYAPAAPISVLLTSLDPAPSTRLARPLTDLGLSVGLAGPDQALRTIAAGGAQAVVIDAVGAPAEDASRIAMALKAAARPRLLVAAALRGADEDGGAALEGFDAVLRDPVFPHQLKARLEALVRLAVMEDEALLRARTLSKRGVKLDLGLKAAHFAPARVLYCGGPSPAFLTLDAALRPHRAELVAAFTSFTAFDYLHEEMFDAVVVNALDDPDTALAITASLRRNTRLFHVPALAVLDPQRVDAKKAFERGVTEIIAPDAAEAEMAARVVGLARERRRRDALKRAFDDASGSGVRDPDTGLVASEFFAEHVDVMASRAAHVGRQMSLLLMNADAPAGISPDARTHALRQMGAMLRHLVRAEDLAAHLSPGLFAVAMPGADETAAKEAGRRLEAVAGCTAFECEGREDPFQLRVRAHVVETLPDESGRSALARAVASAG